MRFGGTILSGAALLWGFVQAPFLHIHPELGDHPAPALLHFHAEPLPHDSAAPAIDTHSPDEDAIDVDWRIASPPSAEFPVDLAVSGAAIIPPPQVASAAPATPQPRGHDPPPLAAKQPRSPPA